MECAEDGRSNFAVNEKKRDEGEEKETYKKIEAAGAEQEEIKNDSVEFETLIDDCRYRIAGEEELRVVYSR